MFKHKIILSRSSTVEGEINKFMNALSAAGLPKTSSDFLAEQVTLAVNRFSRSSNFSNSVFEGDGYKVLIEASQGKRGFISRLLGK